MIGSFHRWPLPLLLMLSVFGCGQLASHRQPDSGTPDSTQRQSIRNNCASLLHELLDEEKNVSKLLIIKRESDDLETLIKTISKSAGRLAETLEHMARQDRSLNLRMTLLPAGEAATRKAIAKTKQDQLLHSSGGRFELQLLLTQAEALNY